MNDLSAAARALVYKPANKVRFVTAASLFDGHDASINIIRRLLQKHGAEVVHLDADHQFRAHHALILAAPNTDH